MDETKELLSAVLEGQQKLAAEVQGIRKEIAEFRGEMKKELAEIKQEISALKSKVEELDDNFDLLARRFFDTRARVKQIEKKVEGQ